ncbi:MAG: hypothetical protein ONB05_11950 [candidate division KSB1 bacterium]|nr:hypothetical protein [candidate division KSB1 bacterium]
MKICFGHSIGMGAVLLLVILVAPSFSQDTTRVALLHFERIGGDISYTYLEQAIPQTLKGYLNRSKKIDVSAEVLDETRLAQILPDSAATAKLKGFLEDQVLTDFLSHIRSRYSYLVMGRFWEYGQMVVVEGQVLDCRTGKTDFSVQADESTSKGGEKKFIRIEEFLAWKLLNEIETNLGQRIRIGIINFKMTGGDTSRFKFLEESIPTMLGTGLAVSRKLKLMEMKQRSELLEEIVKSKTERGIFDLTTALRIGHQINANYLIMGEFWHYKDRIRIDARCVNIETGEIILGEAINLENIEIDKVSDRINALAAQIRITIEKDVLSRGKPSKAIAVVSFPPFPDNRNNKLQTSHIRKTISRKLRLVPELRVKEDPEKIDRYLDTAEDRMKICSDLGVSTLLTLEFENYSDERIILDAEVYDFENPTSNSYATTKEGNFKELDDLVNQIVFEFLNSVGINPSVSDASSIKAIKVPRQRNRYTIGLKFASIERRDRAVFQDDGIGEYGEAFLGYHLETHFEMDCLVGYDQGKKGTDVRIYSLQPFVLGKYNFREDRVINPYAGGGIGGLLLARTHKPESQIMEEAGVIRLGLVALGGIEFQLLNRALSLSLELRWLYGQKSDSRSTASGYTFEGGRLGGFYVTGGVGYNFNF